MSRFVHIDPMSKFKPEPEGFEFGELKVDEEELDEVEVPIQDEHHSKERTGIEEFEITVKEDDKGPIPEVQLAWNMSGKDIAKYKGKMSFVGRLLRRCRGAKEKPQISIICIMGCCIDITLITNKGFKHW